MLAIYHKYKQYFLDLLDDATIDLTPDEFDMLLQFLQKLLTSHKRDNNQ